MIRTASLCLLALLIAVPAAAGDFRLRSAFSSNATWSAAASLDTALGFPTRQTNSGDLRLMYSKTLGAFRVEAHSKVSFAKGDNIPYAAALGGVAPPATLFDLTNSWYSDTNTFVTHTVDRLSVSYATSNVVVKLGRQAVTWGIGMVFHPGDIVASFAPNATDTAYKAGADMLYGQVLFDSGADVQAILVPRATTAGGPIAFDASTLALNAQFVLGALDSYLMLARDRGDSVAALGLGGALGGASWNAELVNWTLAAGGSAPSYLFNISNFGTLGPANISYFAEYFHNGFGVASSVPLDILPASLTKRMSTGQVFLPGRDFLALGGLVQLSADFSIAPSALVNLNDHSALVNIGANYTLGDNTNLAFTYSQPIGGTGTEFGGRETFAGSGVFATPAKSTSLQLVHFF